MRIAQEIILGIGGVRILRQLGINPAIWHMNEGHAAFLVLELMRELVSQGTPFEEALQQVRHSTVFTTHTPRPAAADAFPASLIEQFFWRYWPQLGISHDTFMNLARQDQKWGTTFSMTALALNFSNHANAVSKLHGHIARGIWQWMYPERSRDEVPIVSITNGIHTASWLAPELRQIYDSYLGRDWEKHMDDQELWQRIYEVPNDVLWSIRRRLRYNLVAFVRDCVVQRYQHMEQPPVVWPILDEDTLTIGFARRFASYKRANLIFQDVERLRAILNNPAHPVQIIFAGKAHPADEAGKQMIQEIYQFSLKTGLAGRIIFLEEYDIALARELVRGVDLWLNTPRRTNEASGTSGQKASLNGVPNLSILDGWWPEAHNGRNGWAIGEEHENDIPEEQDWHDAEALYSLLENTIMPTFYDQRDAAGVPNDWIAICKEAIVTVAPRFSTRRMLSEYVDQFYWPIAQQHEEQP
jgi:starch phosphorylase